MKNENWISVNERLPEYGVEVLVSNIDQNVFSATYWTDQHSGINSDGWYDEDTVLCHVEITHWQPFPRAANLN